MFLTKSAKLRESDSEAWKNVFITPDQTYKQRQENKELRNELYERTQKGEKKPGHKVRKNPGHATTRHKPMPNNKNNDCR